MNESALLIEEERLFDTLRSKHSLITGFKQVKKNRGKPGIDGVSVDDFESCLDGRSIVTGVGLTNHRQYAE